MPNHDVPTSTSRVLSMIKELREVDSTMALSTVATILCVYQMEGANMSEVGEFIGVPVTSMSRIFSILSNYGRGGKDGLDLVYTTEDPKNRSHRLVYLTPKGKALMSKIVGTLSGPTRQGTDSHDHPPTGGQLHS